MQHHSPCRQADFGLRREPTRRVARVTVHSYAVRLAFSHLPLHRLLKAQAPLLQKAFNLPPRQRPPGSTDGRLGMAADSSGANEVPGQQLGGGSGGDGGGGSGGGGEGGEAAAPFRESHNKVEIDIQEAAVWLCSDGPTSFGAPDVLQAR